MMEEIPPLQRSPELARMEDAREKLQAAEILADRGRSPKLAKYAILCEGNDVHAKVRSFERTWDKAVSDAVDERFRRGQISSSKTTGALSRQEFLSLATQAQDENVPINERDNLIVEMIQALKQGRVR